MRMWRERSLIVLVFLLHQIDGGDGCSPSSCGKITNISYPFRLKGDPKVCGRYELSCENNITVLSLFSGTFRVEAINYNNFTIRVADPGLQPTNCSLPRYFLSPTNFTDFDYALSPPNLGWYRDWPDDSDKFLYEYIKFLYEYIVFLNCSHGVRGNHKYVSAGGCVNWESKGYMYAFAGDLSAEDLEVGCEVKLVAPTSWWGLDTNNYSYAIIHKALLYGFQLSWIRLACHDRCSYYFDCHFHSSSLRLQCQNQARWVRPVELLIDTIFAIRNGLLTIQNQNVQTYFDRSEYGYTYGYSFALGHYVIPYFIVRYVVGTILFIVFLVYKWRRRHSSAYENIENYLQQNSLMPIRYSYKEIKKMTRGFNEKLGEGGYGFVFKGKLRSGPCVAIKVLRKSKGKGEDFINEVATIGRIHHQNVVHLIGYCAEGSKRALVYEFMSNGSLDKFIFSKEGNLHLTYDTIHDIAIGVARGISYLHHGCEMQILHFDIKPHNILLDEKFTPKISDFGLAKLYSTDKSVVTMTATRGTIGYMAPELFYKNVGRISHKSDVYSFGMFLMEIANKRKNLNLHAEHSSQLYFPLWIYDQLGKGKNIEMEDVTENENKIVKKMIIVSLWCIQLKPNDRPSINKVVEMLEGDIANLKLPPKPSLYPHDTSEDGERIFSNQTTLSHFVGSSSLSSEEKIASNVTLDESI
ncbi:LEAF RUST 10 DISEASE-RESISTANCE LOCUS RECEPTOR-LIKE PROTEIN KINASE-like 2.3 isoform X3 [Vigna angularis]|uniref:LEAF RUST 10 DISEASE-RESISTANCE LOCUS RECEPTOR-LIKE PROTEIN KINASE-like 2.3 isoform X3 n=1 Tax=Phaseolus angularis TaxID=3914 RepID=UPI0022B5C65A|nr:LEAF RUST 10 DISEASE-RESISTANCE LOCUS RECEPTOR-LIKE PROTEIN KINASE-like 2.3 isoform X3 [Vigna angularis]